jgi:hypothetical protein
MPIRMTLGKVQRKQVYDLVQAIGLEPGEFD